MIIVTKPVIDINVLKPIHNKLAEICHRLNKNIKPDEQKLLVQKLKYFLCNENNYPFLKTKLDEIKDLMDSAEYLSVNINDRSDRIRHFSVNKVNYTHFTSPIRRYIDLVVHRMVKGVLDSNNTLYNEAILSEICDLCTFKARNQRSFEKKTKLITLAEWLKQNPIQFVSFINEFEDKNFNVSYPYLNGVKPSKCTKLLYSVIDPCKQPRFTKDENNGKITKTNLDFSRRIYDVETKDDILKIIDDTADKTVVNVNISNLHLNAFKNEDWRLIHERIRENSNDSILQLAKYLSGQLKRDNRNPK